MAFRPFPLSKLERLRNSLILGKKLKVLEDRANEKGWLLEGSIVTIIQVPGDMYAIYVFQDDESRECVYEHEDELIDSRILKFYEIIEE